MTQHTNIADLDWQPTVIRGWQLAYADLDTYDTAENASGGLYHGPGRVKYGRSDRWPEQVASDFRPVRP